MTRALDSAVTYGQHSIWTLQRLEPGLCTFHGMHAVSVDEPLDREAFARAVAGLVGRHEAMRTVFPADARSGLPVPRVLDRVDVPIEWHATNDDTDALLARLWADGQRPYDLDRGPLTRISVYVRPSGEQVVLLAMHHVTSDLGSARLALEELEARYRAIVTGQPDPFPPLRVQYREVAASQHEMLESPAGQRHEDYWRTQLGDGFAALAMPYDRQRPPLEVRRGDTWLFDLPASLITRLESRAREANGTLFPLLLASLQAARSSKNFAALAAQAADGKKKDAKKGEPHPPSVGYTDTPMLPGGKWHVHDPDRPQPRVGLEGKFSIQYAAAAALLDGAVGIQTFTDERRFAADMQNLLGKIALEFDPSIPPDTKNMHMTVEVTLADGSVHKGICKKPPGTWGIPVDAAQHAAKIRDCLGVRFDAAKTARVIEGFGRLESLDAAQLAELLALLA